MNTAAMDKPTDAPAVTRPRRITRRRLILGGLSGCGVLSGLYARLVEPHWINEVRLTLPIAGLPAALSGKRLIQISDLHVGHIVDFEYLRSAVRRVSELKPDLLVITGDLIHFDSVSDLPDLKTLVTSLPRPPFGTLAILGNHDYGYRAENTDQADAVSRTLENAGVRVLRNEAADVAGLSVIGVDDLWSIRFDLDAALSHLAPGRPSLVLCHNPDAVDLPGWDGFQGWILAGHTHGGQCRFPLIGSPILPVKNRRYDAGLIPLSGGRTLYINRGLGYLRRVRFGCRPEITVFDLQPAS